MLRARLHLGGHAEHAGVLQAIGGLEVVERLVKHEVRLAGDPRHTLLDARIKGIQALDELLEVGLVARGIGRVGRCQVAGHLRRDHPGIQRRQPQVCIETARAVVVVMVVVVFLIMGVAVLAEMTQLHARQRLHGHGRLGAALQHAGQETFHVRADPVQQVGIGDLAHVGGAQCVVVRGGARWQQHIGAADTVLNGGGDLLQGLDAGQHTHVGVRRKSDESDKEGKDSGHGGYSGRQKQVT